ncbi:MAG: hypothetical protein WBB23_20210, partial [Desulforhopalus sp.]
MATQLELSLMANRAYQSSPSRTPINTSPAPDGWEEKRHDVNPDSGFEAVSFQRGNEIVISFAGTYPKSGADLLADIELAAGNLHQQLIDAALYYCEIKVANPEAVISFTGHSLGGGLAAVMGVFFDKQAVTFDPAPFLKTAASNTSDYDPYETLLILLRQENISEEILEPLVQYVDQPELFAIREQNVTGLSVEGEILSVGASNAFRIGEQQQLAHGTPDAGGVNLHSMALLTAFLQNHDFRQVTFKLPDLLRLVFDSDLYNFPTDEDKESFIDRLVRYEFGNAPGAVDSDMLTRFTEDMEKIAQEGGMTMEITADLTKALIAFAMQAYYEDKLGTSERLFNNDGVSGGLHFDRTKVSDTLAESKGFTYFNDFLLRYPAQERTVILEKIPGLQDWYIQAGTQAMTATAGDKSAFMLGGTGSDTLTGSDQADLLIGGDGADILNGGGGENWLYGGDGIDTFVVGSGINHIHDTDGSGIIKDQEGNI